MTQGEWDQIQYFRPEEFDSPGDPCTGTEMQYNFVRLLDQLRDKVGFPVYINSGMRTPAHNKEVGGVDSSAHESGWAADIAIVGRGGGVVSERRARVVFAASEIGFRRIGIAATFVHLDMDPTKPTPRIWTYK